MAVKFFGQFLVEKGIVSREGLLAAIDLQEQVNLKLGEMALQLGYVSAADIKRAHNAQYSKDMKLGDILVAMGLLSADQLQGIIARQKQTHLYIGEALVRTGSLTGEQLQRQLAEFNEDQAPYLSSGVQLPAQVPNGKSWEMIVDLTYKMVTRVLGLPFKTGKSSSVGTLAGTFPLAAIDLNGDVDGRYLLSVSPGAQKMVARAILREESVEDECAEILEDSVREFVNVICGNVAAKASQTGGGIHIGTPWTIPPQAEGLPVPDGYTALCFPIHLGDGELMELILLVRG